jgi:uncharacterized protein YndB with AHSA1/START domain
MQPKNKTTSSIETMTANDRDLSLIRLINAPRQKLFRSWTDPELLKQ